MCGGSPSYTPPPAPPPEPEPEQKEATERQKRERDNQRKKSQTAGGSASTQLTGPRGIMSPVKTGDTLLSSQQSGMMNNA